MIVKELIEELYKYDLNMVVYFVDNLGAASDFELSIMRSMPLEKKGIKNRDEVLVIGVK